MNFTLKRLALPVMLFVAAFAAPVQAKLVDFNYATSGEYSTSFLDGYFSMPSAPHGSPEGFTALDPSDGASDSLAFNSYGQSGGTINFYSPVTFKSLVMGSANCCDTSPHADSVTISVYGTGGSLDEQTWNYAMGFSAPLVFNQDDVTRIVFTTSGGGESVFGYDTAFFEVDKITYEGGGVTPVPEPQTYALLLSGLLFLTYTARRARRQAPARTVL